MKGVLIRNQPDIRPFLLWDVDINRFDFNQQRRLVIERVCTLGNLNDYAEIIRFYGIEVVKNELQMSSSLDPKTLNFFSQYFNIQRKDFKCYLKKPFLLQH